MKRLLIIASLLSIFSAFGESFETLLTEEELHICVSKLVCEMDKVEEFYDISTHAGPENSEKYINSISQALNMEESVNTREFWFLCGETFCELPEERRVAFAYPRSNVTLDAYCMPDLTIKFGHVLLKHPADKQ
ncbi:hypothetical protein AVEN_19375-1 [Araneus ventricosus]|uniref:Uncharacterized protein n=2 Tax=Araneus ventricosus TaxID=182803 RepID=A0A4Y2V8N5_ARAVE|nr:hypothetical protein AVEN_19375-1 [Araneus ventricosus]